MAEGTCSAEGCEKANYVRSWCTTHYTRWRLHGSIADRRAENAARRATRNAAAARCSAEGCSEIGFRPDGLCGSHRHQRLDAQRRPGECIVPSHLGETWRDAPRYEGLYEVSDHGRVRSLDRIIHASRGFEWLCRGRLVRPTPGPGEYLIMRLSREGKTESIYVHRLVLMTFAGSPAPDMQGCHNDGNPSNNHAENLRWGTRSDNMQDAIRHGTNYRTKKTHCLRGHPLEAPNLKEILKPDGGIRRNCLTCTSTHNLQRRATSRGRPFDFDAILAQRHAEIMGESAPSRERWCAHGHLLAAPNLIKALAARGHRACYACDLARGAVRVARRRCLPLPDLREEADRRYAEIMGENPDGGSPRRVAS